MLRRARAASIWLACYVLGPLSLASSLHVDRLRVSSSRANHSLATPALDAREHAIGELDQVEANTSAAVPCVSAPSCLEPSGACLAANTIVEKRRPECTQHNEFCDRKVYRLPTTGLKMTLPVLTNAELRHLYSTSYGGQMTISGPGHWRPSQQAQLVLNGGGVKGKEGLTIVEMGCAAGYLLYNLRQLAARGGKLICFEADPDYKQKLEATLLSAKRSTPGLTFEIYPKIFEADALPADSVDVFLSSHVVEHIANPCVWMQSLQKVMKPGGIVFTEVPDQYLDPDRHLTRGQFHLLYFNQPSFDSMMRKGGFEHMQWGQTGPAYIRSLYRKPGW